MLQHYAENSPQANLRHLEWYHLNYLLHLPHRTFRGHAGRVYAVAYSPDGQYIVSGGEDGTVRLWDAATGESVAVRHEHQNAISCLVFNPDGDTFATSSGDKTVKLWSLSQRKVILTLPHPFPVDACEFLDGGKLLGSLSSEAEGRRQSLLWDVPSGTQRHDLSLPVDDYQAVIAGQSGRIAVMFQKNFATVWHRQDNAWVVGRTIDVGDPRLGPTLSPDEECLLVPVWPHYLHIYRLRDGVLMNVLKDHGGGVNCIAFSPSGGRIATASDDSSVCVFEFPSGKLVHRFFGHEGGSVWHVAWSPPGNSLASVGNDGTVRVWDLQTGSAPRHLRLPEPRSRDARGLWGYSVLQETGLWGFAFLNDGKRVNSVYHDGLSLVWNLATDESCSPMEVSRSPLPLTRMVTPFPEVAHVLLPQWDAHAYSIPNRIGGAYATSIPPITNDCTRMVCDGSRFMEINRGQLKVWEIDPWKEVESRRFNPFDTVEFVFDISADGRRMCGADDDGHVYVCDVNLGTAVDLGSSPALRAACFSPSGERILLLAGGKVREYHFDDSKWIHTFNEESATAMRYSADAERIAIAFENGGYTSIYDSLTGEETLRLDVRASEILFSSDGQSLVTDGAPDGGLYYWPGRH
jgi:WD40 repeat protein